MRWTLSCLTVLMGSTGCATAEPESVGPVVFPEAGTAVAVSSARFFALDPEQPLNNSAMRNCRFGRTTKIPMVPALVELGLTSLKISGQEVGALEGGVLGGRHRSTLEARLGPMASVSRELAQSACHPWRAGPEDASMVPALLIAADARAPAASLELIIDVAWKAGFDEAALWAASSAPGLGEGAGTTLTPSASTVAELAGEIDRIRTGGDPCVLLRPRTAAAAQAAGDVAGSPTAGVLSQSIPVLPVVREGNRRLVTGEICGSPPGQALPDGAEQVDGSP